jgi:hypothetical protein
MFLAPLREKISKESLVTISLFCSLNFGGYWRAKDIAPTSPAKQRRGTLLLNIISKLNKKENLRMKTGPPTIRRKSVVTKAKTACIGA